MINSASRRQPLQPEKMKMLPGPVLPGYHVERHDATRRFVINNLVVRCTALEYKLLTHFLHCYYKSVTFEELLPLISEQALNTPAMWKQSKRKLIKAISELRGKIWPCNLTIVYANGAGYMLVRQLQRTFPTLPERRSLSQRDQLGA